MRSLRFVNVKENEMGGTYSTCGGERNLEKGNQFGIPSCKWENNIKTNLKEI
jgi:hypothetical protein